MSKVHYTIFPILNDNPPLCSLNVRDFTTPVVGLLTKATLSCLTRLICLQLSKVPKGKVAYATFLKEHTLRQLTLSFLTLKPQESSSSETDQCAMSHTCTVYLYTLSY